MARPPLKYVVRLKHTGDFDNIDSWLANYAQGAYDYQFEGIHETEAVFDQLKVTFRFEHRDDAVAFSHFLRDEQR